MKTLEPRLGKFWVPRRKRLRSAGARNQLRRDFSKTATPAILHPPVLLVSDLDQAHVDVLAARFGLPGSHFGSRLDHDSTETAKAAFLEKLFDSWGL